MICLSHCYSITNAFSNEYVGYELHNQLPHCRVFQRLVVWLEESGGVTGGAKEEKRRMAMMEENIWRVEDYFTSNVLASIKTAADDLNLTLSTIWVIMRKQLKW